MLIVMPIRCPNCRAKLKKEEVEQLTKGVPIECQYCADIMMIEPKVVPERKRIVTDTVEVKPVVIPWIDPLKPVVIPVIEPLRRRKKKRRDKWKKEKTWYYYAGPSQDTRWKKRFN